MEPAQLAKTARASLAEALGALQSADDAPDELLEAAEPIAKTMGILHKIERSHGAVLDGRDVALKNVRKVLADVQALDVDHPAVDTVLEAVAASLAKVNALAKYKGTGAPAPAPAAQPAPEPAPQPAPQPVAEVKPAPQPAPQPVAEVKPAPQPAPQPVAEVKPAPQPAPQPVAEVKPAPQPAPQPVAEVKPTPQPAPQPVAVEPAPQPVEIIKPAPVLQIVTEPAPQPVAEIKPAPILAPQPVVEVKATPAPQPVAPAPAPTPAPQPVKAKEPAPTPAPAKVQPTPAPAKVTPAPASVKAKEPTPPPGTRTVDVELGTHSSSNFYKGLSGNDVIEHGGIFVSTYRIPKLGAEVQLRVLLPGDYEFYARAVVQWTRESSGSSEPGFGARFTQIGNEGRQLVYRYARNREPMFYDDL
ncbi:hypothetical protein [Polyangium sorediatum]|uniref:PilZ domain-containing protein n=1 Tax=Polyangium sorediatum TaxID=889274 RepID=A0ABT6NHX6_9BACT|nr:hypothetical protein [Polyangium sorediatum]MDI1427862.1 hypothetical protein [Polyangium sorediatum]